MYCTTALILRVPILAELSVGQAAELQVSEHI